MKIGELAKQSGVAAHTIRFYEQQGLLPKAKRTSAGYRTYDKDALKRVAGIQCAKHLGFSLDQIRLSFSEQAELSEQNKQLILSQLDDKLDEINALFSKLTLQRTQVEALKADLSKTWQQGECLEADHMQQWRDRLDDDTKES